MHENLDFPRIIERVRDRAAVADINKQHITSEVLLEAAHGLEALSEALGQAREERWLLRRRLDSLLERSALPFTDDRSKWAYGSGKDTLNG